MLKNVYFGYSGLHNYIRYLLSTYNTYVTVYNYYELWLIILCTMQLSNSLTEYYANNNDKSIFINIFLFL